MVMLSDGIFIGSKQFASLKFCCIVELFEHARNGSLALCFEAKQSTFTLGDVDFEYDPNTKAYFAYIDALQDKNKVGYQHGVEVCLTS